MTENVVELRNVVKRFGDTEAVKDVSLEVQQGEFVALVGPSGCGKTTTLRLIGGLERPSAGTILVAGKDVTNLKPWDRETPMVWQDFALFPFLNVRRNVAFGLRRKKLSKRESADKVNRALELVGIAEFGDRDIAELSGGQKQRVGIARALVMDPQVVLLDEPMSALDANLRVRMQTELRDLQQRLVITFIYVTHNQSEAFVMADRVAVMNQGRLCQVAPPQVVFRRPQERFVAEFFGVNNIFSGKLKAHNDRKAIVGTAIGEFSVVSRPRRNNSRVATFLISADRVVIGGESPVLENSIFGVLRGIEHIGTQVTLLLELEDGSEFRIQKQEHHMEHISATIGEKILGSWSAEDAYVLPDS